MADKREIINYFIDKMNTNIDLSDIVDSDGNAIYFSNPFIPVIFKQDDRGNIKTEIDIDQPLPLQVLSLRFIPVNFVNAELEQEQLYNPSTDLNPLESWVGGVGIAMFIPVEDVNQYNTIYDRLLTFHNDFIKNEVEEVDFFGANRSVEIISPNIIDEEGITLLNRIDYKQMAFAVTMSVTRPNILRSSRRRIQYKKSDTTWEELTAFNKTLDYSKIYEDDTNSGVQILKSLPEAAGRVLAFSIIVDTDIELINDIIAETETPRAGGNIDEIFTFKLLREFANGTITEFEIDTTLAKNQELNETNYSNFKLTFREV